MGSSREYFEYISDCLREIEEVSYLKMMGEYLIYYRGKVIGGIYDDRFLVKNTESARKLVGKPIYELPYEGAKEMLLIEEIEDMKFLKTLFEAMYPELPEKKPKKK